MAVSQARISFARDLVNILRTDSIDVGPRKQSSRSRNLVASNRDTHVTRTKNASANTFGSPKRKAPPLESSGGVLATSYSRTAYRRTTIGAAAFHFRVRNGNGWCHCATVTRVRNRTGGSLLSQPRKRETQSLVTSESSGQSPYLKFDKKTLSISLRQ